MRLMAADPIEYKPVNVLDKEHEQSKKIVQNPPNNSNFTLGRAIEQSEFKFQSNLVIKSPQIITSQVDSPKQTTIKIGDPSSKAKVARYNK